MKINLNLALFLIGLVFILGFIVGVYSKIEIICA